MPTSPTPVPALPTPASRVDPTNFRARADARNAAEPGYTAAMNALATTTYGNAAEAASSATAALASGNSLATSASNAALSASAAAGSAAAAQAAAAALQSGLPAQASTHGNVLRSEQGVAAWGSPLRAATQVAYSSSENEIANSSAGNYAAWLKGSSTASATIEQTTGGPNGLNCVNVVNSGSPGNQYIYWSYTPQVGVTRTASVWWKGLSKPSTGFLIYMAYRNAGDTTAFTGLQFSDASVIADGKWRRYSVTTTHQGATVTPLPCYFMTDTGSAALLVADPMINVGTTAAPYVGTGPVHVLEKNWNFDFTTVAGAVDVFLPAEVLGIGAGATIGLKDYGRAAATNNIRLDRNGALIEDAANPLEIDINGASITLQYNARKGWLIK